jgi:diacylglycerol kinase (ATP)
VGLVGEEFFLNSVGFVLSSAVSWHSRHTGPLTGSARYGMAALRAWADHRPVRMGFDGLKASGDHWVSLMEVGIGDRAGGGYRLTPQAHPADGLLDVCLVDALTRWKIPLLLPRARTGRHLNHPKVLYEQVSGFRLRLDSRTLIHLDGELKRLEKGEYSIRVKGKCLRVRIPRARAEALQKRKEETP